MAHYYPIHTHTYTICTRIHHSYLIHTHTYTLCTCIHHSHIHTYAHTKGIKGNWVRSSRSPDHCWQPTVYQDSVLQLWNLAVVQLNWIMIPSLCLLENWLVWGEGDTHLALEHWCRIYRRKQYICLGFFFLLCIFFFIYPWPEFFFEKVIQDCKHLWIVGDC